MTLIHHPEHLLDRAAMLLLRGMLATQPVTEFRPEARPMFDELMQKTPAATGVQYEAADVGGVPGWWCRPPDAVAGAALLYFHGGAYVLGSAAAYRNFVGQIAVRAGSAAFIADYRRAPEHPFPAAVTDAEAAYQALPGLGYKRVALAGDSAGGGLALVLLALATAAARQDGIAPMAAAVMSPWSDLTLSGDSMQARAKADPLLSQATLETAALAYAGTHDRREPRLSPLFGDLADLPPVLIHVGQDEVLLDDSRRYAQYCEEAGTRAELHVWEGMTHVFPSGLSMLTAAREALDNMGSFLRKRFTDGVQPSAGVASE